MVWVEPVIPGIRRILGDYFDDVRPLRHHFIRVGDDVYGVIEFSDGSTVTAPNVESWLGDGYEALIAEAESTGSELLMANR